MTFVGVTLLIVAFLVFLCMYNITYIYVSAIAYLVISGIGFRIFDLSYMSSNIGIVGADNLEK